MTSWQFAFRYRPHDADDSHQLSDLPDRLQLRDRDPLLAGDRVDELVNEMLGVPGAFPGNLPENGVRAHR
jgi:hypothetical protein